MRRTTASGSPTGPLFTELASYCDLSIRLPLFTLEELEELHRVACIGLNLSRAELQQINDAAAGRPGVAVRLIDGLGQKVGLGNQKDRVPEYLKTLDSDPREDQELRKYLESAEQHPLGQAALAVTLWGDSLTIDEWEALTKSLAPRARYDEWPDKLLVKSTESGQQRVRSKHAHLQGAVFAALKKNANVVKRVVLDVTRKRWRSNDPIEIVPALRFVARLEHIPRQVHWATCTMEKAFEALDANDDELSKERALEDALGDPFGGDGDDDGGNETFLDVLARNDPGVVRPPS